jgi:trehalose 6-phosphate phosphatase
VPEPALEPLRAAPSRAAILSDVDGTLAPITLRPEEASVPPAARDALRRLAGRYGLVGCVSGRRATEARNLVRVDELLYVGNHGLERLEPGADQPSLDPSLAGRDGLAAQVVESLDHARLQAVGISVEDKGPIQALHWRGAASVAAAELEAREAAALAQARGLHPHWGRKVLELRPLADVDKGTVIERILDGRGLTAALYAGDDTTDLDGFEGLRRLASAGSLERAVCVGVASPESPAAIADRADVVVSDTDGVIALLEELAA